jgi:hypothetical protein
VQLVDSVLVQLTSAQVDVDMAHTLLQALLHVHLAKQAGMALHLVSKLQLVVEISLLQAALQANTLSRVLLLMTLLLHQLVLLVQLELLQL